MSIEKNPLINGTKFKHGAVPFDEIKLEHFMPAIDYAISKANKTINKIKSNSNPPSFDNTSLQMETCNELLDYIVSIYFNLSRIDKDYIDDSKIEYLSELMKNEKQEPAEMSYGYFLLAEHERKKKNISLEIDYLKKANQFSFDSIKIANQKTLNYWKNIITKKYNKFRFINNDETNELKKFRPIFIVGLPRSGSTITEALISSSDKDIISLGESSMFNGILAKEFSDEKSTTINLGFVENKILNIFKNKNLNFKNNIFIDKSLENFFYIDVILKIFPQAVFINTMRNIEDNVFAIFKQSLSKLSWTHSIDDILGYIDNYLKIISFFEKKYPSKIFSIHLENITNNTENISKEILDFCNLKWSKEILNFYDRKDLLISTASNIQIRSGIKNYDKEKYQPYKNLLISYLEKYEWLNQK